MENSRLPKRNVGKTEWKKYINEIADGMKNSIKYLFLSWADIFLLFCVEIENYNDAIKLQEQSNKIIFCGYETRRPFVFRF